jgi:hypothetical protein
MPKLQKVLSSFMTLATALSLSGLGLVFQVEGAQLTNASVSLSDARPSVTSNHTITFNTGTAGTIRQVRFQYANAASGSAVKPTNLSTSSATLNSLSIATDTDKTNWSIDVSTDGLVIATRASSGVSTSQGATFTVTLDSITNSSQAAACDAVSNSDSCFIRITTYSDTGSTVIDSTTITYTVVDSVSVTATVDPILTFTVAGVTGTSLGDSNVGSGTAVDTTTTTLPFGNVTVGTAKIAQQKLTTLTNGNNGYYVYAKFITSSGEVMSGLANTSNNIDKFTASTATWSSPQTFVAPTGTAANVNSAWLGLRTSDTDVSSNFTANKYGPPDVLGDSGSGQAVMKSTGPDDGTTSVYVSAKIQANAFQPADQYAGTMVYNVVSTY